MFGKRFTYFIKLLCGNLCMFVIANIMIMRERNKRSKNQSNLIKHCAQLNLIKNNITLGIVILTLVNFTKILKLNSEIVLKFTKECKRPIQSVILSKRSQIRSTPLEWVFLDFVLTNT